MVIIVARVYESPSSIITHVHGGFACNGIEEEFLEARGLEEVVMSAVYPDGFRVGRGEGMEEVPRRFVGDGVICTRHENGDGAGDLRGKIYGA